jgi:EEF1A lysine methyltransferase 4
MDAADLDALRTKEYWESRYKNEPLDHEFDWFRSYDDLAPWLNDSLRPHEKILMLGCGNSVLLSNDETSYIRAGSIFLLA